MTVNATTGIDSTVDRFAIWRVSTESYINLNATWPRVDGGPLVGANPDLKYYKRVNSEAPDADHRFTVNSSWGRVEADPTPAEGHPSGTYTQVFEIVRLPVADLKLQVDAEFQRQVRLQFPDSENPATIIEAAGVIARKQAGSPITEAQQDVLDGVIGMEDQISFMRARQVALYASIDADEDYDITEGWVAL
jgi:hypothetical protein